MTEEGLTFDPLPDHLHDHDRCPTPATGLKLRIQGETFPEIGRKLGITKQAAHHHVSKALGELAKANKDRTAELRMLEGERLDAMACVLWPRATDPQNPDLVAVDRMLRIMDRRAKLFGLDAPTKIAPTTPDGEQSASTESTRWVYYMPKPCGELRKNGLSSAGSRRKSSSDPGRSHPAAIPPHRGRSARTSSLPVGDLFLGSFAGQRGFGLDRARGGVATRVGHATGSSLICSRLRLTHGATPSETSASTSRGRPRLTRQPRPKPSASGTRSEAAGTARSVAAKRWQ